MKKTFALTVCSAFVATMAAAQAKKQTMKVPTTPVNSAVQVTQAQKLNDSVALARRVTREEAERLVKAGKAVYLDVRSKESYDKGHIKGAISTPRSEILQKIRTIPPGMTMITYCACDRELTAAIAVNTLNAHGVKNAAALIGGWNEWVALGLPTEKTAK